MAMNVKNVTEIIENNPRNWEDKVRIKRVCVYCVCLVVLCD